MTKVLTLSLSPFVKLAPLSSRVIFLVNENLIGFNSTATAGGVSVRTENKMDKLGNRYQTQPKGIKGRGQTHPFFSININLSYRKTKHMSYVFLYKVEYDLTSTIPNLGISFVG